jgi:hypothetical protein
MRRSVASPVWVATAAPASWRAGAPEGALCRRVCSGRALGRRDRPRPAPHAPPPPVAPHPRRPHPLLQPSANPERRNRRPPSPQITASEFSPDGAYLATASADSSVIVWHVDSGKPAAIFAGDTAITALAFAPAPAGAPAGATLVAGDAAGEVHFLCGLPREGRGARGDGGGGEDEGGEGDGGASAASGSEGAAPGAAACI